MHKFLKNFTAIALAFALIATFASCGGGADEGKVYNRFVPSKIKPFDPANMTDLYTATVSGLALEGLFQYKYLADSYELEPALADGMPTVSSDGLTYTFKIRKDAFFYDSSKKVFKDGKGRAVTSKDFALSLKRLADPKVESGGWWLFDGFIAGLNEWAAAATASGKADYAANIEGVQTPDDSTLVIKLTKNYPQILYCFAMTFTYPVAQESMDVLGEEWINYLIGTGPYYLDVDNTIPNNVYVFKKNPAFRGGKYPSGADIGSIAKAKGLDKDAGKALPFIPTINCYVIEAGTTSWLKFMNNEIDVVAPPKDHFKEAVQNGKITPEMAAKGIVLDINSFLDITYDFFNMDDKVWGAPNPNGKYLRQAVGCAIPNDKIIELFRNGRAVRATTMIPPGLGGYSPDFRPSYYEFNPTRAKELIQKAGYTYKTVNGKLQAIGPDGKQLTLVKEESGTDTLDREWAEFYQKYLADIGIKTDIVLQDWPTFTSKIDKHQAQFGGIAWGADYPDAQNFLQLLYGPNAAPGPSASNYNSPEYNALYDKVKVMQPSKERDALYAQLAQLAAEDAPVLVRDHRLSYTLIQPWVKNIYFRDIGAGYWKYHDIDVKVKADRTKATATPETK